MGSGGQVRMVVEVVEPTVRPAVVDAVEVRLLAAVLGADEPNARRAAAAALAVCQGAAGLSTASRSQLVSAGLTREQAERVRAAVGLGVLAAASAPPSTYMDRDGVVELWRPLLSHLPHEEMHAMYLGRDGRYMGRELLARGGVAHVSLHIRDVLGPALEARAELLVLAHNHPSGSCSPSDEDLLLSRRLSDAARLLGLTLVDHLVFSADGVGSALGDRPRWPLRPRRKVMRPRVVSGASGSKE